MIYRFDRFELDSGEEIGDFCQRNYGVQFPLTERMSVRADPDPLCSDLARQPGRAGGGPTRAGRWGRGRRSR